MRDQFADRLAEAREDFRQLLKEMPEYPGKTFVEDKIQSLEQKISTTKQP